MVRPTPFTIEHETLPDHAHKLTVTGELDLATSPQLEQQTNSLLADGARRIEIDLANLNFIDSTGLRLLLVLSQQATGRECAMVITNPFQQVQTILKITGTGEELPIEGTPSA